MHYSVIYKDTISDGPGFRVSLYVSGCRNHCEGCHNPESWNFNFGNEFTNETMETILNYLEPNYIKGLTLCGGDPIEPENMSELIELCKKVKEKYPNKDIWLYTGYSWNYIKDCELIKYIDVAVTEKFILSERDISDNNRWRGSRNQRVVDVKASIFANRQINLQGIPNND